MLFIFSFQNSYCTANWSFITKTFLMKNIVILVGDVFIYSSFLLYTVFPLLAINVLLPCQYLHLEGSIKVVLLNRLRKVSFSHLFIIENNFILYRKPVLFSISLFTLEISFSSFLQIPIFQRILPFGAPFCA